LLTEAGHIVTVVSQPNPVPRTLKWWTKALLRRNKDSRSRPVQNELLDFLGPRHIKLTKARPVTAADVPDADAVFATWWETAAWVNDLPASKGEKFYLIQDYEVFAPQPSDRVIETFRFDMQKICVSSYIRDTIITNHGVDSFPVVANAVNHTQFQAPPRLKNAKPRVGLLYTTVSRKRVKLALEAIEIAKVACPELEVRLFGKTAPKPHMSVPDWADYVIAPPQSKIAEIYASCDVWVLASDSEGFGLPILEAMACRTPVVSTRAGAATDLIDGTNGRLVDGTAQAIADELIAFARMAEVEWQTYSDAAWQTGQDNTWPKALARLVAVIKDTIAARST
jgi:glycosyltransferase involved in cell wall biosynthesis